LLPIMTVPEAGIAWLTRISAWRMGIRCLLLIGFGDIGIEIEPVKLCIIH
jgi:ActR/RegA family two-component response regulator